MWLMHAASEGNDLGCMDIFIQTCRRQTWHTTSIPKVLESVLGKKLVF